MGNWDKFNKKINMKELDEQMKEAEANTMQYRKVPEGEYTVKVDKMMVHPIKDGRPMFSAQFRILDGDFENSCVFYNKVLYGTKNDGLMIHKVNEFLRSFGFEHDDVTFVDYNQYEELVAELADELGDDEFDIEYHPNDFNSIIVL